MNPDGSMGIISIAGEAPSDLAESDIGAFFELVQEDIPVQSLEKVAQSFAQQCALVKRLGFDMVTIHMCYRAQVLGQFISPLTNKRKDEFGGPIENRARFPLMVFKAIREAVGKDFIIEIQISGEEPNGGNTVEETIAFLKMAEEYVDIVQVRSGEADPNHPTGYCLEKTPFLRVTEQIKKSGVNMLVSNAGGWFHPELAEKALAEGKLDIIGMARAWISNSDYGELVYSDRRDDLVPCVRCNKCHGRTPGIDPCVSVCTVNPLVGLEHWQKALELPAQGSKSIAVVGGGPAGMRTAIYLCDRGHAVTIYEVQSELGGMIKHSDYVDFKWPLKEYKEYLINQVNKRGIDVRLNTRIRPEELNGKYDAVIAAVGAEFARPPISGIDGKNVITAVEALECSDKVGGNVVIIGGGEVGVETGMYLAKQGKYVTVLEAKATIAADSTPMHYRSMLQDAWEALPNFHFIVNATVMEITENDVKFKDQQGQITSISADTVVISAGMRAKRDEALSFYGAADRFYMVGDCRKPGTIQTANRSAYSTASII
jgi:thioredoxin reductase